MAIPALQDSKLRLTDCIFFGDSIAEAAFSGTILDGSVTLAKLAPDVTAVAIGGAAASHNHSASNITSGTLPVARGGTGVSTWPNVAGAGDKGNLLFTTSSSGLGASQSLFALDDAGEPSGYVNLFVNHRRGSTANPPPQAPLHVVGNLPVATGSAIEKTVAKFGANTGLSIYLPRRTVSIALGHATDGAPQGDLLPESSAKLSYSWDHPAWTGDPPASPYTGEFAISVPTALGHPTKILGCKGDGTVNAYHGLNVFDGDIRLLGNTFIGDEAPSATPRSLLEITHKATSIAAGYGAAFRVNSGAEPDYGTPGANTNIAGQFFSNNASTTNASLWGLNVVVGQGGAPIPAPTPPAGGIHIVGAEIEVFNRSDAGNAELRPVDPYASPNQIRSNGIEIIGHSGSTYRNAGALVTWANDATGGKWWDTGLALSRCYSYGVRFHRIAGDSVEPFQGALLDASELATAIQPLILARSSGDVRYDIKNDADYSVYLNIDSGDAAAAETALLFGDRGSRKWLVGKDSSNHLQIGWNDGATAVSAFSAYIDSEVTPTAALIGFYGTAPTAKPTVAGSKGGNAALASLLTALATLGLITDSTT